VDAHAHGFATPGQIERMPLVSAVLPTSQYTAARTRHGCAPGLDDQDQAVVAFDDNQNKMHHRPGSAPSAAAIVALLDQVQRGESPVRAAERVAPYVRQTHMKDVVLAFAPDRVQRQPRPCGQGLVDFDAILPLLANHRPDLNLSIENPTERSLTTFEFFNPEWHASHTDLQTTELAELVSLINTCQGRIASGEWQDLVTYHEQPFRRASGVAYIEDSAAHLRAVLERSCVWAVQRGPAPRS
jgi:hypothetical protein